MSLSDARALCPDLRTGQADPVAMARFLAALARWATRYCPWVGCEDDGLVMDITGSARLFDVDGTGGEERMLGDITARLERTGLSVCAGLADTPGAAWALARFAAAPDNRAPPGKTFDVISPLPVAALRIADDVAAGLQRLGLRTIADVLARPRATLSRRFGPALLMRIDQALGDQGEPVSPGRDPVVFAARLTLPDPIGLLDDVRAALLRLLERVCEKLARHAKGARALQLTLRRVDQAASRIDIGLARPLRDAVRMAALFDKPLSTVDAGFGIDQMRLAATRVEELVLRQTSPMNRQAGGADDDALSDLVTRLANRLGFDNVTRALPARSHIPEKSFITAPAAYSDAQMHGWAASCPRPLIIFPPEIIIARGPRPPARFRWRALHFTTAQATGPERIAPEWWLDDPAWRSGLRDYWHIQTHQGRRLWLFFTPQAPGWFVQGEFA